MEEIKNEAHRIIKELLRINNEKIKINKYMHELVLEMVENKKNYHSILYEVVNLIPINLYVTEKSYFKFESYEEYIRNHTKYEQLSAFQK